MKQESDWMWEPLCKTAPSDFKWTICKLIHQETLKQMSPVRVFYFLSSCGNWCYGNKTDTVLQSGSTCGVTISALMLQLPHCKLFIMSFSGGNVTGMYYLSQPHTASHRVHGTYACPTLYVFVLDTCGTILINFDDFFFFGYHNGFASPPFMFSWKDPLFSTFGIIISSLLCITMNYETVIQLHTLSFN